MKQYRYETDGKGSEIAFVKKAGNVLSAGALAVLAVSAVGVYAFVGGNKIPVSTADSYISAETDVSQADSSETVTESSPETYDSEMRISQAAVTIRKAGIDEYDLLLETANAAEKSEDKDKEKESEKSEKTAESKTKKKTSSEKKKDTDSSKKKDADESDKDKEKTESSKAAVTTAAETTKPSETTTTAPVTETTTETETAASSKKEKNTETSAETEAEDPGTPDIIVDDEDASGELPVIMGDTLESSAPAEVKACAAMTLFTKEKVNLRTGASLDNDVIVVIPEGGEVIVTGYTDDWYRIKYDGETGYCMKKYLTETAPEVIPDSTESAGVISYTSEEFDMLCYVLQGEVGNCSEASKIAVANVIINRVKDPRFPDSISGVLTQADQFTAIYGYYSGSAVPSDNTTECARRALAGEDNTNGAIYYYAPQYVGGSTASWFESLELCLELDGQRYFK